MLVKLGDAQLIHRQAILPADQWYIKTCLDHVGDCLEPELQRIVNAEDRHPEPSLEHLVDIFRLLNHLTEWKVQLDSIPSQLLREECLSLLNLQEQSSRVLCIDLGFLKLM